MTENNQPDWKTNGLRIVRANHLDTNTPQTPGMTRAAAIIGCSVGAPDASGGRHSVPIAAAAAAASAPPTATP